MNKHELVGVLIILFLIAAGACIALALVGWNPRKPPTCGGFIVSAGADSIAQAGANGAIALTRWVSEEKRYRISVGYVGENGIKPNVPYKLDESGNFIEAD